MSRTDRPAASILVPTATAERVGRTLARRRSVLTALASTAALAACGGNSSGSAGTSVDGKVEDSLNVYSWADYDDPDVLKAFGDTGPRLQVDSYGSNEEMLAKLVAANGASGYDIVVPTGVYIPQMSSNGLLAELDHSKLKNFGNLDPAYLGQSWDPDNKYSVPKDWGTTGFVYDTTVISRDLVSWADFLDAAQKEGKGNTSILEDPWEVTSMYFAANGIDPNTTDDAEIAACKEWMVANLAPNLKGFESNPGGSAIAQSTYALMQCWNGDARLGMDGSEEPDKWKFVYATPTANLWMDNWCITAGAEHPDAAYAFIDFMLDVDNSVKDVLYIGYNTALTDIEAKATAAGLDRPELVFPSQEVVDRLTASQITEKHDSIVAVLDAIRAAAGS
ncbi:spermidine/putrescine ABC transporter substrate-binding protein [Kineococcus sp. GCM10028916]|uniref:polyamine ABC transporter substrate-binding protein n=1 Tax=Kineococcus sp. GCM10028916 TaxID=3273394 RepID=UPI00363BDF7C